MSHSYSQILSMEKNSYFVDVYVLDTTNISDINISTISNSISALDDLFSPREITDTIYEISDKISKVDIRDQEANIVLSTELNKHE